MQKGIMALFVKGTFVPAALIFWHVVQVINVIFCLSEKNNDKKEFFFFFFFLIVLLGPVVEINPDVFSFNTTLEIRVELTDLVSPLFQIAFFS